VVGDIVSVVTLSAYGKKILDPYGSNYSSAPDGYKRMWYNAAKEVVSFLNSNRRRSNNGSKPAPRDVPML
jgi:hypothetical protein